MARRRQKFDGALSSYPAVTTTDGNDQESGSNDLTTTTRGGNKSSGAEKRAKQVGSSDPLIVDHGDADGNGGEVATARESLHGNVKSSVHSVLTTNPLDAISSGDGNEARSSFPPGLDKNDQQQQQQQQPVAQVLVPKSGVQRDVYNGLREEKGAGAGGKGKHRAQGQGQGGRQQPKPQTHHHQHPHAHPHSHASEPSSQTQSPASGREPESQQGVVKKDKGDGTTNDEADEEEEAESCFICAEPVKYWATGVCGHSTCQ
jgi:hypothetical protein